MSEMIERVAKAIYDTFYDGAPWPPVPNDDGLRTIDDYREAAREALEAMRTPTHAVMDAAWQAMIDEALKP